MSLLTPEEEIELAGRMAQGDEEAKKRMSEANLPAGGEHCPSATWAGGCCFWT